MVGEVSLVSSSSSSHRKIISLSCWPERGVVPPLPGPARRGAGSCSRSLWGRWRSWTCRSAAFRASSAARPAGPAFESRDWRAGLAAGAAGALGWPGFRTAAVDDEVTGADFEHLALPRYWPDRSILLDKGVSHRDSLAKYAVAYFECMTWPLGVAGARQGGL